MLENVVVVVMIIKTYEQKLLGSSTKVEIMCMCIFSRLFTYPKLQNCGLVRFEICKFCLHIR
jgi:hypothetical protein